MMELVLGLDIGTSSSKGVLATLDGEIVATATSPRPDSVDYPRPGWAEVDAETVWWQDVVRLCQELVPQMLAGSIGGVCVSGVGPCLLLTDEALRPVRPAILYGIDMRATKEIDELTEKFGAESIIERGGTALSSQAVGPKLAWVRRNEPQTWAKARRWFNSSSYITAKLTGEYVLDQHTASQCDPLYDLHRRAWITEWYKDVAGGLPAPRLADPSEVVGLVTARAAGETGLAAGTPVCAGTVDAWAESFSAGVRRPGDLMLMYGSTMFMVQALKQPRSHPLLWTTAGIEPGSYTLAAGMSTSGTLTEWLRKLLGGIDFGDLVTEAAATAPGADGLVLLPYFAGERTPVFDPDARGVIAGLGLQHTRGHLFRAVYEGVACGIRQIIELLDSAGGPAKRIVAVGGGTQGGLWTQIVSDITGREQLLPTQTIGAPYGDALLAAIGTGLVAPETDWTVIESVISPNPATAPVYEHLVDAYEQLYPATRDIMHGLVRGR